MPLLGSHMSIAGGLPLAVDRAALHRGARRCRSSASRRTSGARGRCAADEIREFRRSVERAGIGPAVVAHASYLINLATTRRRPARTVDRGVRRSSWIARRRSASLGVVIHPGCYTTGTEDDGLRLVADAVRGLLQGAAARADARHARAHGRPGDVARLALRAAGGDDRSPRRPCRAWASASTRATCSRPATTWPPRQGYSATFDAFDRLVGLDRLRVFHVNDSKKPLGSRRDRHEHIGKGKLGLGGVPAPGERPALRDAADAAGDAEDRGAGARSRSPSIRWMR